MDENFYEAPKAQLIEFEYDGQEVFFFPISLKKLTILFISTFSVYTVYWFYKNWKMLEPTMDKKIHPLLRAIFDVFFTHSLFSRIETAAVAKNISMKWSAGVLATIYVVFTFISAIVKHFFSSSELYNLVNLLTILFLFIILWPLYSIQKIVNQINGDPDGKLNCSFSGYNYVFIIGGSLLWILTISLFFLE
jgi:hypothetical protein